MTCLVRELSRSLLLSLLLAASDQTHAAAPSHETIFTVPLSPRIANYEIDVQLDTESRLLRANQVLTWFNQTESAIEELRFHLYLNAFRNSRSTFMMESGGVMRGSRIDEGGWGFIEVKRIALTPLRRLNEERIREYRPNLETELATVFALNGDRSFELTSSMEFIQPDDGNVHDKTLVRLPLPRPLQPDRAVSLDFSFEARLPTPPFARTGAKAEYFFVGQWFPKIAVHHGGAWNSHQFHATSEFFADFGVYDIRITVPKAFVVGGTGQENMVTDNGDGTATHHYHAEDVHDFAWTASPEFRVFTGAVQDVSVRVLIQPDHIGQARRHVEAAEAAVKYFQDHYGDYPYPNLTVVDPRRGAGGSGGMEYPTLITGGTLYGLPRGIRAVEMVIGHEFGHNFWYHLLATNEFEEPWLDEGINTYTDMRMADDLFDSHVIDFLGLKITAEELNRASYIGTPKTDPVYRKAWRFYSAASYGANSYAKPGLILSTLRHYLGPEVMNRAMRAYVRRWRFKHPTTEDFIAVLNEVSEEDLSWYFEQALFSNAVLDYSVSSLTSRRLENKGYGFGRGVDEVTDAPNRPAARELSTSETEGADETRYLSEVKVRRLGEFRFPVAIEISFADGETLRETWDGRDLWTTFRYVRPTVLHSATVDPERRVPLDVNYTNNSRTMESPSRGATKLALHWGFLWQCLLDIITP